MITSLKIIAGTLVVVGIVVGFIELRYAPHTLLRESSPDRPWWLPKGDWMASHLRHSDYVHRARLPGGMIVALCARADQACRP